MNATKRIEELCANADQRILAASYIRLPFKYINDVDGSKTATIDLHDPEYQKVLNATQRMIQLALADWHEALAIAIRIDHDRYTAAIQITLDWYEAFAWGGWPGTESADDAIPQDLKPVFTLGPEVLAAV